MRGVMEYWSNGVMNKRPNMEKESGAASPQSSNLPSLLSACPPQSQSRLHAAPSCARSLAPAWECPWERSSPPVRPGPSQAGVSAGGNVEAASCRLSSSHQAASSRFQHRHQNSRPYRAVPHAPLALAFHLSLLVSHSLTAPPASAPIAHRPDDQTLP